MNNRQTLTFVDCTKLFFCMCIIAMHTNLFDAIFPEGNTALSIHNYILILAVPYFFVTSGYLMGKKIIKIDNNNELKNITLNFVKRLLYPLIVFGTISAILVIIQGNEINENGIRWFIKRLLFNPYGALWYLHASIIAVIILYFFIKHKKLNLALFIGILLYTFGLLCDSYQFVIHNTPFQKITWLFVVTFTTVRTGLLVGFLLFTLGVKCAELEDKLKNFNSKKLLFLFFVSFVVYIIEIYLVQKFEGTNNIYGKSLYISHIVLSPLLLMITVKFKINIPYNLSVLFRNLSTGMYFLHGVLISIFAIIKSIFDFDCSGVMDFIVISLTSLLICVVAYKTKKQPFYGLLK